jgi:hypothetical protein
MRKRLKFPGKPESEPGPYIRCLSFRDLRDLRGECFY